MGKHTSVQPRNTAMFGTGGILPRAKNEPPARFCGILPPPCSNPAAQIRYQKRKRTQKASSFGSEWRGFSRGLKTCHRLVFAASCRRPVRIPPLKYDTKKESGRKKASTFFFGRSGGIRTHGLLDPNQARYQTSPHPGAMIIIAGCA